MPDFNSPFGMTGIPGSNPSGSNMGAPSAAGASTPAIGGGTNPFLPTFPSGTSTAPLGSTVNNASPTGALSNTNLASLLGFGQGTKNPLKDITKALQKAGFSAGIAGELANFLQSGAGFNPQVVQAMIAAMQPGVQRKEADILEQFSAMGLRSGSPAALALGDFLSQEQLNEGQIWAQMYEQSVQNYLNVLLSGKGQHTSGFDQFLKYIQASSTAMKNTAEAAAAGG